MGQSDIEFAKFEGHLTAAGKEFRLIVDRRYALLERSRGFEAGTRSPSIEASSPGGEFSGDPTAAAANVKDKHKLPFKWRELQDAAKDAAKKLTALRVFMEQVAPKRPEFCENPNCGQVIAGTPEDRPRNGRCTACYHYLNRTGSERPWKLAQRS